MSLPITYPAWCEAAAARICAEWLDRAALSHPPSRLRSQSGPGTASATATGPRLLVVGTEVTNRLFMGALRRQAGATPIRPDFVGNSYHLLQHLPPQPWWQDVWLVLTDPNESRITYLADLFTRQASRLHLLHRRSFDTADTPLPRSSRGYEQLTFLIQGAFIADSRWAYGTPSSVASIREAYPGAHIVLSTWRDAKLPTRLDAEVVLSEDPGPLPPLKSFDDKPNNLNRQLVSTVAGLKAVRTSHTVKLRTDGLVCGDGLWRRHVEFNARLPQAPLFRERVSVLRFYTMSMRGIERIPFHISDIVQCGRTEDLLRIWDRPLMTLADAAYYQRQRHRTRDKSFKVFQSRFAVEQYIHAPLAVDVEGLTGDDLLTAPMRRLHDRLLAENFIIQEYEPAELVFQKFEPSFLWRKQQLNCISETEWLALIEGRKQPPRPLREAVRVVNYRRLGI